MASIGEFTNTLDFKELCEYAHLKYWIDNDECLHIVRYSHNVEDDWDQLYELVFNINKTYDCFNDFRNAIASALEKMCKKIENSKDAILHF